MAKETDIEKAPQWERELRTRIAFICMAATSGKEGDLRTLTNNLVQTIRDMRQELAVPR